ncbi:MAG: DUF5110 domain-containing protein, partial [Haloarculaceae archaeon]
GQFAWTPLEWDDAAGELRVGDREGAFPELVEERELRVSVVGEGRATGVEESDPDATAVYDGAATDVDPSE